MFGYKTLFARIFAVCLLVLISALVLLNAFFFMALKKNVIPCKIARLQKGYLYPAADLRFTNTFTPQRSILYIA